MDRIPSELWAQIIEAFIFDAPLLVPDPFDCCRSPLRAVDGWISQDSISTFLENALTAMLVCRAWKEVAEHLRRMVFFVQDDPHDWTLVFLERPLEHMPQAHLLARLSYFQMDRRIPTWAHESNESKIQEFLREHLDKLQTRVIVGFCLKRLSLAIVSQRKQLLQIRAAKHYDRITASEGNFFSDMSMAFPNLVYLECRLEVDRTIEPNRKRLCLPHLKSLFLHSPLDTSEWSLPSLRNLLFEMNLPSTDQTLFTGSIMETLKTIRQFGDTLTFLGIFPSRLFPPDDFDIWKVCPQLVGLHWMGGIGDPKSSYPPADHPLEYLMVDSNDLEGNRGRDFISFLVRVPNLRVVSARLLNWEAQTRQRSLFLWGRTDLNLFVSAAKVIEALGIRFEDRKGRSFKEFEVSKL
jgi:hypothetical protein